MPILEQPNASPVLPSQTTKKAYQSPVLRHHGNARNVTQAAPPNANEPFTDSGTSPNVYAS